MVVRSLSDQTLSGRQYPSLFLQYYLLLPMPLDLVHSPFLIIELPGCGDMAAVRV